jgi:hypothetical protein
VQIFLGRQVVVIKYGIQTEGYCSKETRKPYRVSLWRNIRNGQESFSNLVSYKVGDGSHIPSGMTCGAGKRLLNTHFQNFIL